MERFFAYFRPTAYQLNFTINQAKNRLSGTTTIDGEVAESTIKLHAKDLDIAEVLVDGQPASCKHADGEIVIDNLSAGTHQIKITHSCAIQDNMEGAYYSVYKIDGEERRMVSTQFESHYARECFPCVDEPEAKATYAMTITSADPADTILGNMPVKDEQTTEQGKTVTFEESPRMSTYLVAFAVGRFVSYETHSQHGVKITAYACEHQSTDNLPIPAHFGADVLDYYDDLFGVPFPLPKLDLIAIPDFEAGAMENWGLITFRETAMLANEKSSVEHKTYISTVVAHEIAHMWFGDLVTMKWWDDLWLNESFANIMELYSTSHVRPEYEAWDDFFTSTAQSALRRDCLPGVQPVHVDVASVEDIANLFDGAIVYAKGGRMLLMLMRVMGEDNFFKGIHDYFEAHKYGNTVADDLWQALSKYVDFDVKEFMMPWLTQSGYPVVDENGENQQRFLLTGADEAEQYTYPIRNFADDMSGHYLIRLSGEAFQAKLDRVGELSKEQKIRLLTDRKLLAKAGEVPSASLLPLIQAFATETDAAIWELIAAIIGDLKLFFQPKTAEKDHFRQFLREFAKPQYERLGIASRAEDTLADVKIRPIIMSIMQYAKDGDFIAAVKNQYGAVDIADVNPDYRWIVGVVLASHNAELARSYFDRYQSTNDVELISDLTDAMTAVKDAETLRGFLHELKDGAIRPQNRLIFFLRLLRNYYIEDEALGWMYDNWHWLVTAEGDKSISDYPRYVAMVLRTQTQADEYHRFFDAAMETTPAIIRDVKVGYSDIDSRFRLISSQKDAVYAYLAKN